MLTDAGYTWDGDALIDPDGETVSFTLTEPDAAGPTTSTRSASSPRVRPSLGAEATVEPIVQDTWFNDTIPFGNFQASLHWTDGGSTPWNMYSNIMDGASYVPLGETGELELRPLQERRGHRRRSPTTRPATTDEDRQAALDVVQKHFVEDVPGLVIWSRPAVAQYSTVNYTGFPTDEDPYANPQPTGPQAALILSKLKPAED